MRPSLKVFHWIPRILCIIAILFVSLFALDTFSSHRTVWQNAVAFLIHLLPSFVLLAALVIAWKWEKTGGIIFIIIGLVSFIELLHLSVRNFTLAQSLRNASLICLPFVVTGILFVISHYSKKKERN